MCKSAGNDLMKKKKFADFLAGDKVQEFLVELANEARVEVGVVLKNKCRADKDQDGISHLGPCLVHVVYGGVARGSWVHHPRVAIRLADWCSVKFSVHTNGLIHRYLCGEVTTEESREVASCEKVWRHPAWVQA
jgi:hypothetical protein